MDNVFQMTPHISFIPLCLSPVAQGASWKSLFGEGCFLLSSAPALGRFERGPCRPLFYRLMDGCFTVDSTKVGGGRCCSLTVWWDSLPPTMYGTPNRGGRVAWSSVVKLASSCVLFSQYTERCHAEPPRCGVTAPEERKVGGDLQLAGKDIMRDDVRRTHRSPCKMDICACTF